jgi:hypothetical protein
MLRPNAIFDSPAAAAAAIVNRSRINPTSSFSTRLYY